MRFCATQSLREPDCGNRGETGCLQPGIVAICKSRCAKLTVGEEVVQDPETFLQVWVEYFQKLL